MTSLFQQADQLGFKPDIVTFTTLLQGLLRAKQMHMAKRTLESMISQRISPNAMTAALLVADLVKDGSRDGLMAAEELMREMKRLKLETGVVPWTSLVGGYFRGGWLRDARDAMARMKQEGVGMNRVTYNMLLRETGRVSEEEGYTAAAAAGAAGAGGGGGGVVGSDGKVGGSAPAPSIVRRSALISIFEEMLRNRFEPNSDTYTIVLEALMKQNRRREAAHVVGVMKERGFVPEKGALRSALKRVERPSRERMWRG